MLGVLSLSNPSVDLDENKIRIQFYLDVVALGVEVG